MRAWFERGLVCLVFALPAGVLLGCSGGTGAEDVGFMCEPGEGEMCTCPNGVESVAWCRLDGADFLPCECEGADEGFGDDTGDGDPGGDGDGDSGDGDGDSGDGDGDSGDGDGDPDPGDGDGDPGGPEQACYPGPNGVYSTRCYTSLSVCLIVLQLIQSPSFRDPPRVPANNGNSSHIRNTCGGAKDEGDMQLVS